MEESRTRGILYLLLAILCIAETSVHLDENHPHYYSTLLEYSYLTGNNFGEAGYSGEIEGKLTNWDSLPMVTLTEVFLGKRSTNGVGLIWPVRSYVSFLTAVVEPYLGMFQGFVFINVFLWFLSAVLMYHVGLSLLKDHYQASLCAILVATGHGFTAVVGQFAPYVMINFVIIGLVFLTLHWNIFSPSVERYKVFLFGLCCGLGVLAYQQTYFYLLFVLLFGIKRIGWLKSGGIIFIAVFIPLLWNEILAPALSIRSETTSDVSFMYTLEVWIDLFKKVPDGNHFLSTFFMLSLQIICALFLTFFIFPVFLMFLGYNHETDPEVKRMMQVFSLSLVVLYILIAASQDFHIRRLYALFPFAFPMLIRGMIQVGKSIERTSFLGGIPRVRELTAAVLFITTIILFNIDLFGIKNPMVMYLFPPWVGADAIWPSAFNRGIY